MQTLAQRAPIAGNGFFRALADRVKSGLARRAAYARTVTELNALTARELADLGISRYDIRAIAHQASLTA